MTVLSRMAGVVMGLVTVGSSLPALAGPPLAVTTGSLNTGNINVCVNHMAEALRRVGLTNVAGQDNIVGGETSTVTVMIACLQGDLTTTTRWMVAVTGRDRAESETVRNNVVLAITR